MRNQLLTDDGDFAGDFNVVRGGTSYTVVLPDLHVNFVPRDDLIVRAAVTRTIGRPSYADLAPISELDAIEDEPGIFAGSLSSGNPDLKPYESINVDLSVEFYMRSGLLTVAPFYKRMDNPIFGRSVVEQNFVYDGRLYERFGLSQPENADRGHIGGVEFNYQNMFTTLPAPFDGFGVNLNYTVADSSVTVFARDDELPFFKQSTHIGNVAVLYEKAGVAAQVAVTFNSPFLRSIGANTDTDGYGDPYRIVDRAAHSYDRSRSRARCRGAIGRRRSCWPSLNRRPS